jgi:predicted metal-dependent phosphoesterase TrpH
VSTLERGAKIDLHMHTTLSDGKLTPAELVQLLARREVAVAAISDHDSTEGIDEALAEAEKHPGLRILPAVEISADHPTNDKIDVHVLGYFFDYHDREMNERLASFRDDRVVRARHMVARLAEEGYPVEWERVLAIAGEAGIGRPHIAQAMVERGYIATVRDAFNGLLNDDGIAFVGRPHITMRGSAELIHRAGGVAVLAHPIFIPNYEELLPQLAELGFVGFEVHYGDFDPEQRKSLLDLAERYGMLPCGGSDYHAMGHEGETLPGNAGPPVEVFEELERLALASRPSV